MILPVDYKKLCKEFLEVLNDIIENDFYTEFKYHSDKPTGDMQYWEFILNYFSSDERIIENSCGFFTASGSLTNTNLNITQFFQTNDKIVEEFYLLEEQNVLNKLLDLFKKADAMDNEGLGVAITITSYINGGNEWLQNICEECLLIVHLDEKAKDRVVLGCQQSERYKIKVEGEQNCNFYIIPFDRIVHFRGAERVEGYNNCKYYNYQVALSFAGEDREYVDKVAAELRKMKIRLFYDRYEEVSLWGKNLYTHLDEVYQKKSMLCVLFLSKFYKEKAWTNHERESAQARAFEERKEYILPIRLDSTEIPGIRPTIGYIDGSKYSPKEIAELVEKKIRDMYF